MYEICIQAMVMVLHSARDRHNGKIHSGPRYIEENFPLLDSFKTCTVERGVKPAVAVHPNVRRKETMARTKTNSR